MGSLSTGATFAFWLFYTILILVAYHKLFAVVYFDTAKGLLREFIIAAIAGIILTGISLSKPIVGIVVIIIVALIGIGKVQSGGGKVVIVILAIVACVIVGIVGRNVQKNMDDNEKNEQEIGTEDTSQNYERNEDDGLDNNSQNVVVDKKVIRLDDFNLYNRKAEELEEALGVSAQNAGVDIVYLEEYLGYGFSDGSLIMYDEEYGACIIAEYSDLVTISVCALNTDMSLEEASGRYIAAEMEQIPLQSNSEFGFKIGNGYYIILSESGNKGIKMVMRPWKSWVKEQVGETFPVEKVLQYVMDNNYFMSAQDIQPFFEQAGYEVDWLTSVENYEQWYSISEGAVRWFDGEKGLEIYLEDIGDELFSLYGLSPKMTYDEATNHLLELGAVELGYSEEKERYEFLLYDAYDIYIIPDGEKTIIGATGYDWGINQEESIKTQIDLNAYFNEADTADRMAELLSYDGYDIVYLEDYDGYGLADESLILQNYDIGTCIMAEYSEETIVSLMGINTDMSLEEADDTLINYMGAVITPLSYEGATTYNLSNWYYITLYSAGEKGIKIVAEPYWGE